MLPTEPIGSIPRPPALIEASAGLAAGTTTADRWEAVADAALRDTLERFARTGSPVVTDGEQTKSSFATYPLEGLDTLAPDGAVIPFADGHTRQLPRLASGPFHYARFADTYLRRARTMTDLPVKQAVIAVSALSLLYPEGGVEGYDRDRFVADLVAQGTEDIRRCLDAGAHSVQIDFTEGRLSLKLDPSGGLLRHFLALNSRVLEPFSAAERARIGVHTCPGGDRDSTHSADVDYAALLPDLLGLDVGSFYVEMAGEADRAGALALVARHLRPGCRVFVGVTNPIVERVETPDEVAAAVLEAAAHIPVDQLGTTDDCGFSPFGDDTSTSRDTAFSKIAARVEGTRIASERLGV